MKYLVDSDWIIDGLKGYSAALNTLRVNAHEGLAISVITIGEVLEGAYGYPDYERQLLDIRTFLAGFRVLGLTSSTMELFARHRYTLRRSGNLIPDTDLLIGCTALEHNLLVMTRNRRHFSRIPSLALFEI